MVSLADDASDRHGRGRMNSGLRACKKGEFAQRMSACGLMIVAAANELGKFAALGDE
jgi:hypothetical protein